MGNTTCFCGRTWDHHRIAELEAENKRLRGNLRSISEMGHNDDCLFCARKDYNAQEWAARDDAS